MRTVNIDLSNPELSAEYFAGYKGEVNSTVLNITLPENLLDEEIDYYRAHFKTSEHESYISGKLYAVNGVVSVVLGYELMCDAGTLLMQVSAFDMESEELVKLGKSPTVKLKVKPSLPSGSEGNLRLKGLEAELEELVGQASEIIHDVQPVMVNTFTDLPTTAKQGKFAIVRNPPPVYEEPRVERFFYDEHLSEDMRTNYTNIYINPSPPNPIDIFPENEQPPQFGYAFMRNGNYNPTVAAMFSEEQMGMPWIYYELGVGEQFAVVYSFYELDLNPEDVEMTGDTIHVDLGWNCVYVNDEEKTIQKIPITSADLPVIKNAGCFYSSFGEENQEYAGCFFSSQPYPKPLNITNVVYYFDNGEWHRTNTVIPDMSIDEDVQMHGLFTPEALTVKYIDIVSNLIVKPIPLWVPFDIAKLSVVSSDESVAFPFFNGNIVQMNSIGAGQAVITVSYNNGEFTDSCTVTVQNHIRPSSLNVRYDLIPATLKVGDIVTIEYTVLPENATYELTWSTDNRNIAYFVGNELHCVGPGWVYLGCSCEGNYSSSSVTIVEDIT